MAVDIHADRVLVVDFGSQYTQLIARRVREAGVYCEILPFDVGPARIAGFGARGYILSGGPESVAADASPRRLPSNRDIACRNHWNGALDHFGMNRWNHHTRTSCAF